MTTTNAIVAYFTLTYVIDGQSPPDVKQTANSAIQAANTTNTTGGGNNTNGGSAVLGSSTISLASSALIVVLSAVAFL